jgi:hypothetical protein
MYKPRAAAILFAILLGSALPAPSVAGETHDICATYENTGKTYHVELNLMRGTELNRATKTYDYAPYTHYGVIFWGEGQASIIELDSILGQIGPLGTSGTDKEGHPWILAPFSGLRCR